MTRYSLSLLLSLAVLLGSMPSSTYALSIDLDNLFKPKQHNETSLKTSKPLINYRKMVDRTRKALFSLTAKSKLDEAVYSEQLALDAISNLNSSYYEVHNMLDFKHRSSYQHFGIRQSPSHENVVTASYMVLEHRFNPNLTGKTLAGFSSNIEEFSAPLIGSDLSYDLGDGVKFNVNANHGLRRYDDKKPSTLVTGGFKINLF